jgi:hypothetical protein
VRNHPAEAKVEAVVDSKEAILLVEVIVAHLIAPEMIAEVSKAYLNPLISF